MACDSLMARALKGLLRDSSESLTCPFTFQTRVWMRRRLHTEVPDR